VQNRGYVVKEDREGRQRDFKLITLLNGKIKEEIKKENTGAEKSKLFPTDIGMVVNDFLISNFEEILNYNFTASVEKQFDEIAEGQLEWRKMLQNFYGAFHQKVESTIENSDRANGERLLGVDPASGKKVFARIGKFGALIQIGESEDEDKPKFSSLKANQRLESITFEEAMELFKLPRIAGQYENSEMQVATGRFGPYIKHLSKFYSIKKEDDPLTISELRAIEIIEDKRKAESERLIKTFSQDPEMQVLNGRWGPYLAKGKANYKLPKGVEPKDLSFDECLKIIDNQPQATKKAASKKPTAATSKKSNVKNKVAAKTEKPKASAIKPKTAKAKTIPKKK